MTYCRGSTAADRLHSEIPSRQPVWRARDVVAEHHGLRGGVAPASVRKGGPTIQEESDKTGIVPVGSAVITTAGKLPCKAVIHAVGPKIGEGNEDHKLTNAVRNALLLASEQNFSSVSMPAISSGTFGFPKDKCAKILVEE